MRILALLLWLLAANAAFADLKGVSGCGAATTAVLGCVKPDGSTITVSGGVISAVGGAATSVPFSGVTAATNANALLVGTGGSLGTSGTGTIAATSAAGAIAATTLSASGAVSGAGFSTYLASPPAIGGSTAAAGNFSTLGTSGLFSPSLGITAIGATLNFNASSNFATNINTGTSNGAIGIGNNTSTTASAITTFSGADVFTYGTSYSAANWGLTSPLWNVTALTMNDTTASGTVTNDAAMTIQAANFTSTGGASTTITNAQTLYISAPTCTTVVCTNLYSLNSNGGFATSGGITFTGGGSIKGAIVSVNASSNFATNINTGTSSGAIHIGDGSGNNTIGIGNGTGVVTFASPVTMSNATIKLTGLASSSAATTGTVCWTTGNNALTVDTTVACLASSRRWKQDIESLGPALDELMQFRPVSYDLKPEFNPAHLGRQIGLIAEEVADIDPRLVSIDDDGQPRGVRYMQMVALLIKGMQEQQAEINSLKREIEELKVLH